MRVQELELRERQAQEAWWRAFNQSRKWRVAFTRPGAAARDEPITAYCPSLEEPAVTRLEAQRLLERLLDTRQVGESDHRLESMWPEGGHRHCDMCGMESESDFLDE